MAYVDSVSTDNLTFLMSAIEKMQDKLNYLLIKTPSLKNRALNYGDGCFTTMMSVDGDVELLDLHVSRLLADLTKLAIFNIDKPISGCSLKSLIKEIAQRSFRKSNSKFQIIKLLIARGDSERGYEPSTASLPIIIPTVTDYHAKDNRSFYGETLYSCPALDKAVYRPCIQIGFAEMNLSTQTLLSGVKHLNRLEQVFAKMELAKRDDVDDLLLTLPTGLVVELTSSNFFYHINGVWHTPKLDKAGVNGVMRQFILSLLHASDIECKVSDLTISELSSVEAAFSCNAVTKVMPIASIKLAEQVHALNTQLSIDLGNKVANQIQRMSV